MNYVVWDLETDSADTNWLTILEIGAILLDENFKEIERFSARCRIPQDRVPSATALCINRSNIDLLTKKRGSRFDIFLTMNYTDRLDMTFNGLKTVKVLHAGTTPYKIQIENVGDNEANENTHINFELL